MNYERDSISKRMRIKSSLELSGDEPGLIKGYLETFSLPLLRRALITLNITTANSNFHQIANTPHELINYICLAVTSEKRKLSFHDIDKLFKNVETDAFSGGCITWLKNDMEACHYFWWVLIHLEWKDIFSLLRAGNIHHYSNVLDENRPWYISDTFSLPRVIAGHKERYKIILTLLNSLPFTDTEINILISYLSRKYKKCKEICRNKVNITPLTKNKESVTFSITYLNKKNIFFSDLEPLTETDNKCTLITQLYLLSEEHHFKELVTSLTKAWSQKKIREKRKEAVQNKPAQSLSLSKESIKMLNLLSKKHGISHSELLELAVQYLHKKMQ